MPKSLVGEGARDIAAAPRRPVPQSLRLALAQIGLRVGDFSANVRQIADNAARARRAGADLIVFPELTVCGYLPEDLLLKRQFIDDNLVALKRAAAACRGITAIIGFVDRQDDLYNAAAVVDDGEVRLVYHKQFLPNYGVFDEVRYFKPGVVAPVFVKSGVTFGVNICEDLWHAEGPATVQAMGGRASLIINLTASPYHTGKPALREAMLARRSRENGVVIVYTNQVGGQDDLVFDGGSLVYGADGRCLARGPMFEEALMIVDLADLNDSDGSNPSPRSHRLDPRRRTGRSEALSVPTYLLPDRRPPRRVGPPTTPAIAARLPPPAEIYRAIRLGLSDYAKKNSLETVVVGLSGGIDSALVATLAVDALGADHVVGLFMASRYTAKQSGEDAAALATRLGIRLISLPIEEAFQTYLSMLSPLFAGRPPDIAEENLQARIRATILMAMANKFGWLVLATGNKSEISVGYATLYGDMAGGFAPIKDLWKTTVYALARWRNRQGKMQPIPTRIFRRPPTAELRPDQTDEAALAPYAILDPILRALVEDDKSVPEIVKMGFDRKTVARIAALVARSEFKRRQAPIGVKISPRAFGKDRRMPMTHGYVER